MDMDELILTVEGMRHRLIVIDHEIQNLKNRKNNLEKRYEYLESMVHLSNHGIEIDSPDAILPELEMVDQKILDGQFMYWEIEQQIDALERAYFGNSF